MTQPARKPILIAGGGLASLLLGQALRRAAIPFAIYEKDASLSFRAQGYRLRLSSQGLDSIESVLSKDDFAKFWDECGKTGGGGQTSLDALTGAEPVQAPPKPEVGAKSSGVASGPPQGLQSRDGKIVGISRGAMRQHFMKGCESEVHWGRRVSGYEITPTGVHAVFADGSKSVEGEMIIGGDGIGSGVGAQLSKGKLKVYDTGARIIHGQAPVSAFDGLGEGVWMIADTSRPNGKVTLITNVRPEAGNDPDATFGWTMVAQPGVINIPNDDITILGSQAANMAKSLTSNWHPRLKPLFDRMEESEAAFWKITCSTPSGVPQWQNEPRVTVIGDAVHSMTPAGKYSPHRSMLPTFLTCTAALGANTAMRDSALLGKLLAESHGSIDGVTAKYEAEMRAYASEAVATSYGMAKQQLGLSIKEDS
jgi:2-polyprenyl-6-methoxyphenol hydroxylase-like FAD-dependent oxidoreductase